MIDRIQADLSKFIDCVDIDFPTVDFDEVLEFPKSEEGRELILRLLRSRDIEAFQLATYIITQEGPGTVDFFSRVVETLDSAALDGRLCFANTVLHHNCWHPSFAPMLLSCLESNDLFARAAAIKVLSTHDNAMVDVLDVLSGIDTSDLFRASLANAYKKTVSEGSPELVRQHDGDAAEIKGFSRRACVVAYLDLGRAVRGLYIAQLLRTHTLVQIRIEVPGEDSSIYDVLEQWVAGRLI